MGLSIACKVAARRALGPLLYRYPPVGLQPERLHEWLGVIKDTGGLPDAVLEVGCNLGGTAAVAARMMRRIGDERDYICIDTFGGFIPAQFAADVALGNNASNRDIFSANSTSLVRSILTRHGAAHVGLVQGDIVTLPDEALPDQISAVLIDVDLAEPVRVALERVFPRLVPGGIILVDDCPENYAWQARKGYEAFMGLHGLDPEYRYGLGIVQART